MTPNSTKGLAMAAVGLSLLGAAIDAYAASGPCRPNLAQIASDSPQLSFTESVVRWNVKQIPQREVADEMGVYRKLTIVELETEPNRRFTEAELFNNGPSDLIVAIDTTGNTEGHMYLAISGPDGARYRYDGRLFFRPSEIAEANWKLSDGLIIRYRNIPIENKQPLLHFIAADLSLRSATCVGSACRLLYEVGGFKKGPGGLPWFPPTFLRHLARQGLVGSDGKRIVPEIYTLNRKADTFWNRLPTFWRIWRFILPVLFNPATWGMKRFDTGQQTATP